MKIAGVFLFLALTSVSAQIGLLKTALRVKWGIPLVDSDFFIDIHREEAGIKKEGWVVANRPDTHLPALKLYCPDGDYTVCTLYDDTGFIAGIQVAIDVNKLKNNPNPMDSLGFIKWTAPDGLEYWANQQYFISEESLKKSPAERIASRTDETLQEGAVWVRDLDGSLLRVANTQAGIVDQGVFEKQACIVSMGDHYYKDLKQNATCDAIFPWFMTVNDGNLVASGMLIIGELPEVPNSKRVWFEHPSVSVVKAIVDQGPQCLFDLVESVGGYTMHIYYGKHPYLIFC